MAGASSLLERNIQTAGHGGFSALGRCRLDPCQLAISFSQPSAFLKVVTNRSNGKLHTQDRKEFTRAILCDTSRVLAGPDLMKCIHRVASVPTWEGRTNSLAFSKKKGLLATSAHAQARQGSKGPVTELLMDIPITYINATDQEDPEFSVVVFQRDANPANARFKDMAWKVRSPSEVCFAGMLATCKDIRERITAASNSLPVVASDFMQRFTASL